MVTGVFRDFRISGALGTCICYREGTIFDSSETACIDDWGSSSSCPATPSKNRLRTGFSLLARWN